MVNIIDKHGKPTPQPSNAGRRQSRILDMTYTDTKDFLLGKSNHIPNLEDLKTRLKKEPNNPFGMHLEKGHSNAQVQRDCLKLRAKNFLEAKEFGRLVLLYNNNAVHDVIADTKDKKKLDDINKRFQVLKELPKKATYY